MTEANRGRFDAPWATPENIAYLRDNWVNVSSLALAERFGTTKNAVVGRAHRMRLPAKPSPIRRGATNGNPTTPPAPQIPLAMALLPGAVTLPALASLGPVAAVNRPARAFLVEPAPVAAPRPVIAAPVRPVVLQEPRYAGKVEPCCWITSKGKPWLYCEVSSEPGRAYCQEHGRRAVVKRRDDGDTAVMYAGVG